MTLASSIDAGGFGGFIGVNNSIILIKIAYLQISNLFYGDIWCANVHGCDGMLPSRTKIALVLLIFSIS